jgi:hypothetical protein
VSATIAVQQRMLPGLGLWSTLIPNGSKAVFHEDNTAMIRVAEICKNPTMRHLHRVHGVSIARLHEELHKKDLVDLRHTPSEAMAADILTKACSSPTLWKQVCLNTGVYGSIDELRANIVMRQQIVDYVPCATSCVSGTPSAPCAPSVPCLSEGPPTTCPVPVAVVCSTFLCVCVYR